MPSNRVKALQTQNAALKAELAGLKESESDWQRRCDRYERELAALKAQEPVAWVDDESTITLKHNYLLVKGTKLFTAPQPAAVPAGWKLVPVDPTDEMMLAWVSHKSFNGCYKAMLAAAPEAPHENSTNSSQDQYKLESIK